MKSEILSADCGPLVRRAAAALGTMLLCVAQASADDLREAKTPRPLPHMEDIKTPPNDPAPSDPPTDPAMTVAPRTARAQNDRGPRSKLADRVQVAHFEIDHLCFDEPGDGAVWALGARYKASFAASGATYVPFLGSCAPRDYPVRFRLESIEIGGRPLALDPNASAVRDGARVTYDRGGIVERYAMSLGSVEQEFELARIPEAGELVLRIGVDTALEVSETSDGLRWSNALGAVSYSRAVVVDANGVRTQVDTHATNGAIEIRVPSAVIEHAAYPIVIDPVISTFVVDASTYDDTGPDIAFDAGSNVYEVCWERAFSASDHDCYSQLQDASGATIVGSRVPIDFTMDSWGPPRTADNRVAQQFLVAAEVTPAGGGNRVIKGRTRQAAGNVLGPQFLISDPLITDDQFGASVGGDPSPTPPTYYCVAWERAQPAVADTDIFARLVRSDSTLLGTSTIFIDDTVGTIDELPSVSRSDGNPPNTGQDWTIVWQRRTASGQHDIRGAQVHWDGVITHGSFSIDASAADDELPSVSSVVDGTGASRNYLVVYQRFIGPDHDIQSSLVNGASVLATADLSASDGFVLQDQVEPSVDSDGAFYAVAYSEQFSTSTTDYDIKISTYNVQPSGVVPLEVHQNLASTVDLEFVPRVVARHSGGAPGSCYAAVWSKEASPTDHDIFGGVYCSQLAASYCGAGSVAVACPCANPGASEHGCNNSIGTGGAVLASSGESSLGSDTLLFTQTGELASSLSIFLQGSASVPSGIVFGGGVRCAAEALKRLFEHNASGGVVSAPANGDSSVHARSAALGDAIAPGSTRFYQVYYRDGNLAFCAAGFNVGSARAVAWSP
jgi:hypothetical protein